jgi:hypothetical protein
VDNFAVDEPLECQELFQDALQAAAWGQKKTQYGRIVILPFSPCQSDRGRISSGRILSR